MAYYLIAGAAGYVGSQLAQRLLEQGHRVRGLVRNADTELVEHLAARGMVVWQGDLTRPETLVGIADGIDYVYNLTSRLVLENGSVERTFIAGNQNLIAACSRARSVRAYVFTSNAAVYGDAGEAWLNEDSPVAPTYPLGHVMAAAERAIMELVQRHHFPAIILRLGAIYGPGRDLVEAVEKGLVTIYGAGRNFVSHIHIDDLLPILEAIAPRGQPGGIYNVGDDEPLRMFELYALVRRRLGMLPPRTYSPEVALGAGLDPTIVGRSLASARLSNARLKDELGLALRYPSVLDWLDERLEVLHEQVAVA